MSPEERARGVVRSLCEPLDTPGKPYLETPMRRVMAETIATAIREAEDAAYERAGKAATQFLGADPFFRAGALFCEASILALKSKEP